MGGARGRTYIPLYTCARVTCIAKDHLYIHWLPRTTCIYTGCQGPPVYTLVAKDATINYITRGGSRRGVGGKEGERGGREGRERGEEGERGGKGGGREGWEGRRERGVGGEEGERGGRREARGGGGEGRGREITKRRVEITVEQIRL